MQKVEAPAKRRRSAGAKTKRTGGAKRRTSAGTKRRLLQNVEVPAYFFFN